MIPPQELRRISRERRIAIDLIEKDYVLGWILHGIVSSSISDSLAFKGGTALSKVYFPGSWRISEDLDFTLLVDTEMPALGKALMEEVPRIVLKSSGISVGMKKVPFTNPSYLQSKFQFTGPINRNTVKIEISKEAFIGSVVKKSVPKAYDYPEFSVKVYSLNNISAEKFRALIERGKIRDYYDAWKLLKVGKLDRDKVKNVFLEKCSSKGIKFTGIDQFFPEGLVKKIEPYMEVWLTRLSPEPLPPLEEIIAESKNMMKEFFS